MTGAPAWVRLTGALVRALPRGRYAAISTLRARPAPFLARLAPALGGGLFECDFGDEIAREACLTGWYEPQQSRIALAWLRRGSRVVDAGANWGYFTLLAAGIVGPSGAVLAIEPDVRHAAALERNIRLNGFTCVQVRAVAAAARRGRAGFEGYRNGTANRGLSRLAVDSPFTVDTTDLDSIVPPGPVDLVKIDVEGAEDDVLEGMAGGLAVHRYRAILLELHPAARRTRGAAARACEERLERAGYRGWAIDGSPGAYRRAAAARADWQTLLLPLAATDGARWPHQFWIAPGEACA